MNLSLKQEDLVPKFIDMCSNKIEPIVLELGIKRSRPDFPTHHKEWVKHASRFLGTDLDDGLDVDFTADLHNISNEIPFLVPNKYDIIISCSTFEHIRNPFIASKELYKITNEEGIVFIQTHNCFPLHAYPYDYWRYSIESLTNVLEEAGFKVLDCAYQYPAQIHSEQDPNTKLFFAFLNIAAIAQK